MFSYPCRNHLPVCSTQCVLYWQIKILIKDPIFNLESFTKTQIHNQTDEQGITNLYSKLWNQTNFVDN